MPDFIVIYIGKVTTVENTKRSTNFFRARPIITSAHLTSPPVDCLEQTE